MGLFLMRLDSEVVVEWLLLPLRCEVVFAVPFIVGRRVWHCEWMRDVQYITKEIVWWLVGGGFIYEGEKKKERYGFWFGDSVFILRSDSSLQVCT